MSTHSQTIDMDSVQPPPLPSAQVPGRRVASRSWARSLGVGLSNQGRSIAAGLDWLFGLAALLLGLAILSVIPVLNLLSLGYLLQASGRVASSGRLRDGLIGIHKAAALGRRVVGAWLVLLPLRFVAGVWRDADIVAPGNTASQLWRIAFCLLAAGATLQIAWACLRGGRLRHFLWPAPLRAFRRLSAPGTLGTIGNAVAGYLRSLRLPHYFWLGARGLLGAALWLGVPVGLLVLAAQFPPGKGGALLSLLGGLLLSLVVVHLPFLQTRFAMENRFAALFELKEIRHLFRRAPVAFWFSLLITLLFALPLYLLKIELPPREIAWLPSLVFVLFMLPAHLLTGWAVGRALRSALPRHGFFCWSSGLGLIPVALLYVVVVYMTQYLSWNGTLSLLEQHAFLFPAPLL